MDEKSPQHLSLSGHLNPHSPCSSQQPRSCHVSQQQPSSSRQPSPSYPSRPSISMARHRRLHMAQVLQPWLPLIMYGLTSLGFIMAIALYKTEVFAALDELSQYLQQDPVYGYAVLYFLIFLTTIPPIPLYSTLTILSGYTFGATTGAVISYCAALSGALAVFAVSRTLLRETISRWLSSTCTIQRVVRAIEKRPKLLFLVRLAPYPYNVMNCLLAASPTLTLRTYTICTALSLFKVIIHTSVGASIHSFSDYHMNNAETSDQSSSADSVGQMWTIFGIILCVAIFIYLSVITRRAVDEELEDEESPRNDFEEASSFLDNHGSDLESNGIRQQRQPMTAQSPLSLSPVLPFR